jgi:hypothetical protein
MKLPRFLPWNHYVANHRKIQNPIKIPNIDKQHQWYLDYNIDAIRLGRMCEKFPGLQNSWNQFKMVYELCRSQDDIQRQNPENLR